MSTRRLPQRFLQRCGVILLLLLAASRPVPGKDIIRNSSRECAICHIRWVEAFDRPEAQEGRMQSILDRQAGSGDMCLSCHDGSTIDSRFTVWSTRHHTTDRAPSPAVHIPTEKFPLSEEGHMTCATCHTAHAVPENSDLATVIFLRQPNVDSSLCLACHSDHAQKDDRHHPLGATNVPIPQAILDAGGRTAADGRTIICQTCHEPHGARNAWMLVLPPSQLCTACHTDKSPDATPAAGAPVHKIGHAYPGFEPPAALLSEKATFGPGGELTCLSCHRLHDASGAWPLLIRKNHDSSLCFECHQKEKAVIGSPHDLRLSSPQTVNAKGEAPSLSGPCGACHRIHGWARDVPDAKAPHSSGCMECHRTGGPGTVNRPYVEAHPVGIPLPEGKSTPLPLDEATGSIGCLTCHDPHTPRAREATPEESTAPAGLAGEQLDSNHAPRSFLRREGSQLCVLCHDEKAESLDGPHDPAHFTPSVRQALGLHSSAGACRACHATHNAQGPHLWARASANVATNPCGACHGTDAVKEPQETRHPVAMADLKLPIADLNDGEAGCAACHDPHKGSTSTGLLRRPSESLCNGCHKDKQGVVGSVHDPGASEWGQKLGFTSQGTCVDCHPIHGPSGQRGIWASLPANGAHEQSCQACHRAEAPGPAMDTPHIGKPFDSGFEMPDSRGKSPGHMNPQSVIRNSQSMVQCTSCHEIHRSGQDPMLLRMARHDSSLCLVCHTEFGGLIGTPHDLRESAPKVRNIRGETAVESGPCSSCHIVHPTSKERNTWAQGSALERKPGSEYCTCCHRENGCAKDRVPKHVNHPEVAITNRLSPEHPDYMPIFNEQGEPARTGAISCPTCHDLHVSARTLGAEGGTSLPPGTFLRNTARRELCIDCHGFEALWRFLYYHESRRNPHPVRSPAE
jgi:predicted CXXCH cytochrome family protein